MPIGDSAGMGYGVEHGRPGVSFSGCGSVSRCVVIGGGAAGLFGAVACGEAGRAGVTVLEGSSEPLGKVRLSGGGRCNLTHACFDPAALANRYPRGGKALRGPFARFQPRDTMAWFGARGVPLKTEPDGRVFPASDRSGSVVECLLREAQAAGVVLQTGARVTGVRREAGGFRVAWPEASLAADCVLLATGGAAEGHAVARGLGHTVVQPVPSLFALALADPLLEGLAGVSVPGAALALRVPGVRGAVRCAGPVVITHGGLSGPAVLALSSLAARRLHDHGYRGELTIDWAPGEDEASLRGRCERMRREHGKKRVQNSPAAPLPARLWRRMAEASGVRPDATWSHVEAASLKELLRRLSRGVFAVAGRAAHGGEFVTCGGVSLKEVDFRTMESRVCPGLYLAGEILDVDGPTGGFNLQNAWTTGWLAGTAMASGERARHA
jgi:predicted Rossmann fold flavoprotein